MVALSCRFTWICDNSFSKLALNNSKSLLIQLLFLDIPPEMVELLHSSLTTQPLSIVPPVGIVPPIAIDDPYYTAPVTGKPKVRMYGMVLNWVLPMIVNNSFFYPKSSKPRTVQLFSLFLIIICAQEDKVICQVTEDGLESMEVWRPFCHQREKNQPHMMVTKRHFHSCLNSFIQMISYFSQTVTDTL